MTIDVNKQVSEGQFTEYHIAMESLMKFGVECTQEPSGELVIRYYFGNGNYKECRPRSSSKWKTVNLIKEPNLPFGYHQLPLKGDLVVITGGEKDVLAFDMLGVPAISMQSETVNIPAELVAELKQRFVNVLICFDLDETGVKFSKKWEKQHGLTRIELPDVLNGKDIYDFYSEGRTKEELKALIHSTLKNHEANKTFFSAKEVLEFSGTREYIIDGILPKSNLAGLIGGSDTGKSLFCLQLGLSYILSKPFLGFEVKGGKKVLFFSFEDDSHSLKSRLSKMISGLSPEQNKMISEKMFFEFDPEGIEQKIDCHMEAHPDTGMIIVDPLAEILQGIDINSSSSTRESMQVLKRASTKYNIAVLFIHHINKSSEDTGKLSKSKSLGSQAIEAKSRLMIEMKKRSNGFSSSYIEIGIVKGNDVDERYKASSKTLNLQLDTATLWFNQLDVATPAPPVKIEIEWGLVFGENKKMRAKEIIQKLEEEYGLNPKQSEKAIEMHLAAFKITRGVYSKPENCKGNATGRAA